MITTKRLVGATVLVVADRTERELELASMLSRAGCTVHRWRAQTRAGTETTYDAGLISARHSGGWTNGLIAALRSSDMTCASVVLLDLGNADTIAQTFQAGAFDCHVAPDDEPDVLESVSLAISCTKRWRARVSDSRASLRRPVFKRREDHRTRVFEPEPPATASTDRRIEDIVDRVSTASSLTPREQEVLHWLLHGHRYDDIATILGIAPRTAKFHAANLLRKLDLDSRYDLPMLLAGDR